MQTCIIEIAYGAVAVGPSNRNPPAGMTCTVLEKVFRPAYYRLKRRSIIFVGKFSRRKCSCVDDKTFVLLHTGLPIFPVSCQKSVSQRDTAVSSQKRPKSVLDTDDPYHVACLLYGNSQRCDALLPSPMSSTDNCTVHQLYGELLSSPVASIQ